jgi:DNA-directed RNA polymerase beta' subunit
LKQIKLLSEKYDDFKKNIITKHHLAQASPGECVGIIGAQSIGERQTQTTLNTFHTAGKLQQSGVGRLEEILSMTKKLKIKTCVLYFKEQYKTSDELRKAISCTITGLYLSDLYTDEPDISTGAIENYHSSAWGPLRASALGALLQVVKADSSLGQADGENEKIVFDFNFNSKILYNNHLNTFKIATAINKITSTLDCQCNISIKPTGLVITFIDDQKKCFEKSFNDRSIDYKKTLDKILVCGMKDVVASHLDHDGKEWLIVTEGSNLKKMLSHPLIDNKRLYCNDFWEVYNCLGIAAVRKMLLTDLKKAVCGVNTLHVQLLVDKMTFKGKPCSITRYTMRNNDVGPLSKATFEESTDILLNAAMKTEIENNAGVSAAIISGNQPKIGTGFMGLLVDYKKLIKIDEENETDENNNEPTQVYY